MNAIGASIHMAMSLTRMLGLNVNVGVVVVFKVLKVWPHYLVLCVTHKVDLAFIAHNVAHSITKVVVEMNSYSTCEEQNNDV